MKVIIAGGRDITDECALNAALFKSPFNVTEVVCGKAAGTDTLGSNWAIANTVPVKYFPANWNTYGRAAGPIRNKEMADYADALILIWDGKSRGSANMLKTMQQQNKPIYQHIVRSKT